MGYGLLADLTMLVLFTFLACVVFGGFVALNWPRVIWAHVLLVAWGLLDDRVLHPLPPHRRRRLGAGPAPARPS